VQVSYTVVLVREKDGRYSVSVPALKGCHTWGESLPEALRMAREAVLAYLEGDRALGKPPPPPDTGAFAGRLGDADEALVCRVTVPLEEAAETVA
jgi:predicted RNase H-like HicB family nuclease